MTFIFIGQDKGLDTSKYLPKTVCILSSIKPNHEDVALTWSATASIGSMGALRRNICFKHLNKKNPHFIQMSLAFCRV
jgi:hypothetical protein